MSSTTATLRSPNGPSSKLDILAFEPLSQPKGRIPQPFLNPKWLLVAIPAWLVTYYGSLYVFLNPYKILGAQPIVDRMVNNPTGIPHIAGSMLTVALSPLQFSRRLRRIKSPLNVHRWLGRLCNLAVLVGGVTGLHVAYHAGCYTIGRVGFGTLAAVWLAAPVMGTWRIWEGDVAGHRRWMVRFFALTYAAVMLRWQLPIYMKMGMTNTEGLTLVAWTCWVPNLAFAEWHVRKTSFGKT